MGVVGRTSHGRVADTVGVTSEVRRRERQTCREGDVCVGGGCTRA